MPYILINPTQCSCGGVVDESGVCGGCHNDYGATSGPGHEKPIRTANGTRCSCGGVIEDNICGTCLYDFTAESYL